MMRRSTLGFVAPLIALLGGGAAWGQGFPPEEAARRLGVPDGFRARLVAAEPVVRQPVTISFDDRGRLWVLQYLQYPHPAGLKPVKVDNWLRTVYDKLPEPPPRGPRGADRITILEDPDANGRFRKAKDFVTGLNLASGMALGRGGVYVAQPPYLLFYPDKNGDDVPDGPPEVLLSGFGMEDAHAFPNSLQWGPDGWLYGAQGSTVTSRVRGVEFQQGIWRYHPVTRAFELFAEGGGNTWGLDFDKHGNIIAGTNYGNVVCLHQVQGAYYVKNFGKHGELHNPYAFGYFEHMPYLGFKGGHVTCGGILYDGGAYPAAFDGSYIAANPLGNAVYRHTLTRDRSSFTSRFAGDFVIGNDTWFRPVDLLVGPDGDVYVADWYDKRINHVDPLDNWDKSNGRIYKVEWKNQGANAPRSLGDVKRLGRRTSDDLVDLLSHPNGWYVREARRILSERRDPAVLPRLRQMIDKHRGQLALEALWALYVSGGFDDGLALRLLEHPNEDVRTWSVRLLGDRKQVSAAVRERLTALARTEPSPVVRNQLACTCKRLPGKDALPIVRELLRRSEDVDDPQIPLLLWWAVEDKAASDREAVLDLLSTPAAWRLPLVHRFLVERLGRRYLAEGTEPALAACSRLLAEAPTPADADLLVRGMGQALEGRKPQHAPAELDRQVTELWRQRPGDLGRTRLALRLGNVEAYRHALHVAGDPHAAPGERVALVDVLGQLGKADCVPVLLRLLAPGQPHAVRMAALTALQPFPAPHIADAVLGCYPGLPTDARGRAQNLLAARPASARLLLEAVDAGRIADKELPLDLVHRLVLHRDPVIGRLVEKHWGKVGPATAGEKEVRIRNLNNILARGVGDRAHGKAVFTTTCAKCHTLFGEGGKVGPDLTGADRKSREFLLSNIVDPSAVIRNEYLAYVVATTNGRLLTGLIAESTPKTVTLLDEKAERTVLARDDIDEMRPSPQSLMPEKILDPLEEQDVRDLFAYLQGDGPVAAAGAAPATEPLPGTKPLAPRADFASDMVAGIDRFLLRQIDESVKHRARHWHRDTSSAERYNASIEPNREHLRKIIGANDAREKGEGLQYILNDAEPGPFTGRAEKFQAFAVRWPVMHGVDAEGLLLIPGWDQPVANIVALPDADQTPEMIAGLTPGVPAASQFARRLAESGCQVLIPTLIDRADTYSVSAAGRATNQPHREYIYRPAFEMGRHIIGYEVQKVLAAVDYFERTPWPFGAGAFPRLPAQTRIGVIGYGEGGLLALYAGALDPRIHTTCVSGSFDSRQDVWQEPIYRNVFALLHEFGDAELASMVAPRALIVEASRGPEVKGPPPQRGNRGGAAPGRLVTPPLERVRREFERAQGLVAGLSPAPRFELLAEGDGRGPFGREKTLAAFVNALGGKLARSGKAPEHLRKGFDPQLRLKRQFDQLDQYTQYLLGEAENTRQKFWAKADRSSVAAWEKTTRWYRDYFSNEVIGRFELPRLPLNPRSRKIYDEPKFTGYEVMLDVFPDVFAYGILLVPKDLKPGERRPVVVCQHGLEGRPRDVADPRIDNPAYHTYAARLAEQGFITYAPQNPYIFTDRFRTLQRKANPLKKTLFSIIVPQHQAAVDWLASLPMVDPDRIAFYGLSYGGKTAMRVPPLVSRYCLSICSADFNEWIWKNTSTRSSYSYVTSGEYEIFEFDLGSTFNYAEMAGLIAPRPFMVERGHKDGVAPDQTVAYEYAKVRGLYMDLGIEDRTTIEFFNGPHTIHGVGTFAFLRQHLKWPGGGAGK